MKLENSMAQAKCGYDSKGSKEILKRQIKHKSDNFESGKKGIID